MALSSNLDEYQNNSLEENDATELDVQDYDPFLFDDPMDPFPKNSPYIEESKLNDFFNFQSSSAINLIHINCSVV